MLDEVARNHTSWVKNEVPLPGKNVGINFRVTFNLDATQGNALSNMDDYQSVFLGLWLTLSTIVVQAMVLIRSHRRQKGCKVAYGPISNQDSLFRSYRTFLNSLENIVPMFGMAVIAVLDTVLIN